MAACSSKGFWRFPAFVRKSEAFAAKGKPQRVAPLRTLFGEKGSYLILNLVQIVCAFQTTDSASRTYIDADSAICTCCVPAFGSHLSPRRFRNPVPVSGHPRLSGGAIDQSNTATDGATSDIYPMAPWDVNEELFNAWKAVQASVTSVVAECMTTGETGKQWTVLCGGHSAGGAIATIAAQALAASEYVLSLTVMLVTVCGQQHQGTCNTAGGVQGDPLTLRNVEAQQFRIKLLSNLNDLLNCSAPAMHAAERMTSIISYRDASRTVVCYTFGSPKIGEQDFVIAFNTCVHTSWRMTVGNDSPVNNAPTSKQTYSNVKGNVAFAPCEDGGKVTLPEEAGERPRGVHWSRMHGAFPAEV